MTAPTRTIGNTTAQQPPKVWASREDYLVEVENQRRDGIRERRLYYDGAQYDADNEQCLHEIRRHGWDVGEKGVARSIRDYYHLPEHLRRHAYATQHRECVDFIADRLAEGFTVEASSDKKRKRATDADPASSEDRDSSDPVQQIIDDCLAASPELSGGDDEDDQLTIATVLREAGKAGDTCALIRWDNVEQHCWLEFWNSEQVDMRFVDDHPDRLERVLVDQLDWREVPGTSTDGPEQCVIRREWLLSDAPEPATNDADDPAVPTGADGAPVRRCVERVWVIDKGEDIAKRPVEVIEWGVPVLPWWPLRVEHRDLRDVRGTSLITDQAMRHVDRYDANEQVSWLIARYNSHSNVVATGEVMPQQTGPNGDQRGTVVRKDIMDALVLPGAVNVTALTLPTDPQMIEHQRKVLLAALYASFGLRRMDSESVSDQGEVSGYALEILNQRDEGTMARIRARLIRDLKTLFGRVVDCHVAWDTGATTPPDPADDDPLTADPNAATDPAGGDEPASGVRGDTDPYPRRTIRVTLGSGWVVDDAKLRDDNVAGTISRRGMWRERGKSDDWIDQNEEELEEEKAKAVEQAREKFEAEGGGEIGRFGARGATGAATDGQAPPGQQRTPAQPGQSQQAGRTVNDARTPAGRDQAQRASAGRSER